MSFIDKKILFIIFIALSVNLFAQSEYELWKQKQEEQYRQYKDAQDKAFVEFLEKEWKSFDAFKGIKPDEIPKPVDVPETEITVPKEFPDSNIVKDIQVPKLEFKEEKIQEKESQAYIEPEEEKGIEVDFFGLNLHVNYSENLKDALEEPLNEKAIADFWYKISNSDYEPFLKQAQEYKNQMNLNDWGYCLFLNKVGKKLTDNSKNLKRLFVWFMLIKSGYQVKLGFVENAVFLLLPSKNVLFGVTYLILDEQKFYVVNFEQKEKLPLAIQTYEGNYPDADDLIDLRVTKAPLISKEIVERELRFKYKGETYILTVQYNLPTAKYFENYPLTDLNIYFNAPLTNEANFSVISQLKDILEEKPEAEAVNILLRFVQTAFQYKTDDEQFGREKSFFSEETLFYPFCDCEDRSVFFSYLVRNLLGLNVIGLDYPGHIATAVKFNTDLEGDSVTFNNEKYLVCDPTYVNANIGLCMPDFKNVEPKIIELN